MNQGDIYLVNLDPAFAGHPAKYTNSSYSSGVMLPQPLMMRTLREALPLPNAAAYDVASHLRMI